MCRVPGDPGGRATPKNPPEVIRQMMTNGLMLINGNLYVIND